MLPGEGTGLAVQISLAPIDTRRVPVGTIQIFTDSRAYWFPRLIFLLPTSDSCTACRSTREHSQNLQILDGADRHEAHTRSRFCFSKSGRVSTPSAPNNCILGSSFFSSPRVHHLAVNLDVSVHVPVGTARCRSELTPSAPRAASGVACRPKF